MENNFSRGNLSFRDKLLALDYVLIFLILLLGLISLFAMYSTDGGKFDYHTRSHILRFGVFWGIIKFSPS